MEVSNLATAVKAEILRILAAEKISMNELSRRRGVSQQAVVDLLRGGKELSTKTIEEVASALGMVAKIVFEPSHETVDAA
jgi:transcriptional regulator with XRE-family HTH domain